MEVHTRTHGDPRFIIWTLIGKPISEIAANQGVWKGWRITIFVAIQRSFYASEKGPGGRALMERTATLKENPRRTWSRSSSIASVRLGTTKLGPPGGALSEKEADVARADHGARACERDGGTTAVGCAGGVGGDGGGGLQAGARREGGREGGRGGVGTDPEGCA